MNRNRHDRASCSDTNLTLGALVSPSPATAQREAARKNTHAAMLAEFARATAPEKEPLGDPAPPEVVMVTADGWQMSSLDRIDDPNAAAAALTAIVAKHRASTR